MNGKVMKQVENPDEARMLYEFMHHNGVEMGREDGAGFFASVDETLVAGAFVKVGDTLDIKTGIPLEGIACISYFYVLPMMRGQKTGSLLAGVVESTFRNGGFPEMYVSANTPEFWKKRGYDHLDKAGESYLLRKVLRP